MLKLLNLQSLLGQWSLAQASCAFLLYAPVVYIFYLCIMNRYFHPLSQFPGPFWASITPLYSIYIFLVTGEEHLEIEKLHKKYGPIIRYSPGLLLFADPKMIPIIYNRYANKTEWNHFDMLGEATSVMGSIDHKEHSALRRKIASPYNMTSAREMEPIVDDRIMEWKEKMDREYAQTGIKLDYGKWSQYFAYDVISEVSFGKPFGFIKSGSDVHNLIQAFHSGVTTIVVLSKWDSVKKVVCHPMIISLLPTMGKENGIGRLIEERNMRVNERLNSTEKVDRVDLMEFFLNNKDLSLGVAKSELLTTMAAGSDTTAGALRGILMNILQTPGCYEKLMAEINDYTRSRPEFSVIKFDEAQNLKYLTACIKESMRYSTATPMILPRAPPEGGLTLEDGRYIPEGVKLAAHSHVTQRNKELYGEDADAFVPERWLESKEKTNNMEKHDLQFGGGSRVCLGKNIAYLELWKATFELFRTFKPTIIAPEKIRIINVSTLIHKDLWITLEKRV